MNKFLFLAILFATTVGCGTRKVLETEEYLTAHSAQEKIYIISVLPNSNESTGRFISTLLVSTQQKNKTQLAFFGQTMQPETLLSKTNYFCDSIEQLDETKFPILLSSPAKDSLNEKLSILLGRKQFKLNSNSKNVDFGYSISYKKQTSLSGDSLAGIATIRGINSSHVTVSEVNGKQINQESTLILNVFDNPTDLHVQSSTQTHYLLDFQLFSGDLYSIYYAEKDFLGITILNSNYLPNSNLVSALELETRQSILRLSNENSDSLEIIRNQGESFGKFAVEVVQIKKGDQVVGNGILYSL